MRTDQVSGIVLVVFALVVIWESRHLPLGTLLQPGPAFCPVMLAVLLLIFGLLVALAGGNAPLWSSLTWSEWRHALAILGASVFSVLAIERLGYRLSVLIILLFLVKLVEKQGWVVSLVFSLAVSLGSYFLFYTVLRVPLP